MVYILLVDKVAFLCYNLFQKGDAFMNSFIYDGFGYVVSNLPKEKVDITTSKAYKELRGHFLDSITIDILSPYEMDPPYISDYFYTYSELSYLPDLYSDLSYFPELNSDAFGKNRMDDAYSRVFVVPTIESFGVTPEIAIANYDKFLSCFHVIILDRPDLSTVTLDGEVIYKHSDRYNRENLVAEFAISKFKRQGRKAKSLDVKFRKVFWDWQNFFISTEDALSLLNMSRGTFFTLSNDFMTDEAFRTIYLKEHIKRLSNGQLKPIRGITLSENDTKLIIRLHRHLGKTNNWGIHAIQQLQSVMGEEEIKIYKECKFAPEDFVRLRLNVSEGRAAMARCSKQYNKGPEYVEILRNELEKM